MEPDTVGNLIKVEILEIEILKGIFDLLNVMERFWELKYLVHNTSPIFGPETPVSLTNITKKGNSLFETTQKLTIIKD